MAASISVELRGFKELQDMLHPRKLPQRMQKHVEKATKKNALVGEGAIKEAIAAGKVGPPNAAITVALKGSSRPLVDSGELLKSINGRALEWDSAVIGVLRSAQVKDPDTGKVTDVLNVAQIVHEGATIDVTDRMRAFFGAMAAKYRSGQTKRPWRALRSTTKVIVIPPRPFLKSALTQEMIAKYRQNWDNAVQAAMSGRD